MKEFATQKKFDNFYVSEYARAIETAALLGLEGASWKVDFMIRELDKGIFLIFHS